MFKIKTGEHCQYVQNVLTIFHLFHNFINIWSKSQRVKKSLPGAGECGNKIVLNNNKTDLAILESLLINQHNPVIKNQVKGPSPKIKINYLVYVTSIPEPEKNSPAHR